MKYPLENGKVGIIKWDHEVAKRYYQANLRIMKMEIKLHRSKIQDLGCQLFRPGSKGGVWWGNTSSYERYEIHTNHPKSSQTTNVGTSPKKEKKDKIVQLL